MRSFEFMDETERKIMSSSNAMEYLKNKQDESIRSSNLLVLLFAPDPRIRGSVAVESKFGFHECLVDRCRPPLFAPGTYCVSRHVLAIKISLCRISDMDGNFEAKFEAQSEAFSQDQGIELLKNEKRMQQLEKRKEVLYYSGQLQTDNAR
jgi:hypothetical protein